MKLENSQTSPELRGEPTPVESTPDMPVLPAPETIEQKGVEKGAEQKERTAEAQAAAADANDYAAPAQPVVSPTTQSDDAGVDDSQSPLVANDDDVIEKEWVDRAKKVISDTKDDPYKREEEVGKLQKDYLQKRYGKSLGASS